MFEMSKLINYTGQNILHLRQQIIPSRMQLMANQLKTINMVLKYLNFVNNAFIDVYIIDLFCFLVINNTFTEMYFHVYIINVTQLNIF